MGKVIGFILIILGAVMIVYLPDTMSSKNQIYSAIGGVFAIVSGLWNLFRSR